MPKFRLETDYFLNEVLQTLGMPDAFVEPTTGGEVPTFGE